MVTILNADFDEKRLYWMEYHSGDLKSAWYNGSDSKTIISTSVTTANWNIEVDDDLIFYSSMNQILAINKSSGQVPSVVHTDVYQINAVLLYDQEGRKTYFTIRMHFNFIICLL